MQLGCDLKDVIVFDTARKSIGICREVLGYSIARCAPHTSPTIETPQIWCFPLMLIKCCPETVTPKRALRLSPSTLTGVEIHAAAVLSKGGVGSSLGGAEN